MTRFNRVSTVLLLMLGLAFSARAQTTTVSTTLSAAVTTPSPGIPAATTLTVASATGFVAGTTSMFVDQEFMDVQAVNGTTITVARGRSGQSTPHANAAVVFVGARGALSPFIAFDRQGSCTRTEQAFLPQINTRNGYAWDCINGIWVRVFTNLAAPLIRNVISGLGATRTLLTAESGSLILLDRAAGIVATLPAPAVGLVYDFYASVSVTSNAYKFSTATQGTDFIVGDYLSVDTDTGSAVVGFPCNGTTHDNFSMNGTTTGGLIGTRLKLTAISTTLWLIEGENEGSGVVATACSTT